PSTCGPALRPLPPPAGQPPPLHFPPAVPRPSLSFPPSAPRYPVCAPPHPLLLSLAPFALFSVSSFPPLACLLVAHLSAPSFLLFSLGFCPSLLPLSTSRHPIRTLFHPHPCRRVPLPLPPLPGDPGLSQPTPSAPTPAQLLNSSPPLAMSNNMAKIAEARKTVEQLKLEVNIDRMKVSQAAAELLAFCETHAKDDPLVTPVPAAENPFRDKRLFCVLL
uniref:Guanine nucleotide-binding protein subunit gamma n=1 Tax=Suricata suricatta TaxID=37032 RepID=A0A673UF42_SURSU